MENQHQGFRKKGSQIFLLVFVWCVLLLGCTKTTNASVANNEDSSSLSSQFDKAKDGSFSFRDEVSGNSYLFNQERKTIPIIIINQFSIKADALDKLNDLNQLAHGMYTIALNTSKVKAERGENYENIYVSYRIPFGATIVFDLNNNSIFIPRYFNEILHILNTYKTEDVKSLLSIPEAKEYLYMNGFLNKDQDGWVLFNGIKSSYSVFISDGQFTEYFRDQSTRIVYSGESSLSLSSSALPKSRKSYWGEGEWLVSVDYDDFTDTPIHSFSLATSSTYDSANMWLYIRHYDGKSEVFIRFSTNVSLSNSATVTYRIDQLPSKINEKWKLSTNKQALFYQGDVKSLILNLFNGDGLLVSVKSGNNEYRTTFKVSGLKATMNPYLQIFGIR